MARAPVDPNSAQELSPPQMRSSRSINTSHVVATGSTTALLAGVLVWVLSWLLKPLDAATASDLAGLIVAAGADRDLGRVPYRK